MNEAGTRNKNNSVYLFIRFLCLPVCGFGQSALLIIAHLVLNEGSVLALRVRVEHWWVFGVLVFGLLVRVRVEHWWVFGVLVFVGLWGERFCGFLSGHVMAVPLVGPGIPTSKYHDWSFGFGSHVCGRSNFWTEGPPRGSQHKQSQGLD
jgi:hypothetical protein